MQALEYEVRRWPLKSFPHGLLYRDEAEFIFGLGNISPEVGTPEMARACLMAMPGFELYQANV